MSELGWLLVPRAYRFDPITAAVLWAVANLDQALLLDDARLHAGRTAAAEYTRQPRSAVSAEMVADLDSVSRMWLGSRFCADHIHSYSDMLVDVPAYWTREQRGEETSTWLLFAHKMRYLRETTNHFGTRSDPTTRLFCIPESTVVTTSVSERILVLLAMALMESFGIHTAVTSEPEFGELPGLVLDRRRAIMASWLRAEGLWQVDVTDHRSTVAGYRDTLAHVRAHSLISADTPDRRLCRLADYLGLDWAWLQVRCAELGEHGLAGIAEPRSRLLSLDGVDQACRFVGALP